MKSRSRDRGNNKRKISERGRERYTAVKPAEVAASRIKATKKDNRLVESKSVERFANCNLTYGQIPNGEYLAFVVSGVVDIGVPPMIEEQVMDARSKVDKCISNARERIAKMEEPDDFVQAVDDYDDVAAGENYESSKKVQVEIL